MPTITLNKQDVLRLVGKKLSDNTLKEKIPMLGAPLESLKGNNLEIEVFANRPDMLSEEGFARAFSSFVGIKKGLRPYVVKSGGYSFSIQNKTKNVRPCVAAAVAKGLRLKDNGIKSLMDLQEKLCVTHGRQRKKVAIGIHDLDAITFPLTYTTKPANFTFTPLGETAQYTITQILNEHSKGKEYGPLLEGCTEYPVWIDRKGQVLSLPPIINAEETKVTGKTQNLFFDVTGTDQRAVEQALNILVTAAADRGAAIYRVNTYPNLKPRAMKLDNAYVKKLLGIAMAGMDIKTCLERMGFAQNGKNILIPPYRTDILHPMDLVEEIAIAYGYDRFAKELPSIATVAEESSERKMTDKLAELLASLGFLEVTTFHLTNEELAKKEVQEEQLVKVKNAISTEYNVARPSLLSQLLTILASNKHNEYPQKVFEIGTIFSRENGVVKEELQLALTISHPAANVTEIKQVLDALCTNLDLKYTLQETDDPRCIPGRSAQIFAGKERMGILGEVHPELIMATENEMPVAMLILKVTKLSMRKN